MREILKKFTLFLSAVFCVLFNMPVFGVPVWQDTRRYVSDEEWAKYPYNNFVELLITTLDTKVMGCTAQYVAPNIIVSAGHCVHNGASYRIKRYDNDNIPVELIDYEHKSTNKDWALFLITDSAYYKNDNFNVKIPNYENDNIVVMNAGWGGTKILSAAELQKIREDAATYSNFRQVWNSNYASKIIDEKDELKVSDSCNILGKKTNKDVYNGEMTFVVDAIKYRAPIGVETKGFFPVDCVVVHGNSGGGIIQKDGNVLYGIVSYGDGKGVNWLYNRGAVNMIASTSQFVTALNNAKQKYPVGGAENTASVTQSNNTVNTVTQDQSVITNVTNATGAEITGVTNPAQEVKAAEEIITEIEQEIKIVCDDFEGNIDKIKNMSDQELFKFLNDGVYCEDRRDTLTKLRDAYEAAKAKEQSLANRALTAATVAATGIGAMELAQGLSEQRADKAAAEDMAAYIATFRCDYGGGKSVKAGPDEIELPGGNNQTLMNYRAEYFALANDLKDRKTALNIKPGIESEAILDKAQLGLYDDENTGITSGAEASLYRAQMLKSESDQSKLDEASSTSQKRVKGGAIALGAGVVGGIVGNAIINRNKDSKDNIANVAETVCSKIDGASWKNGKCYCVGNNKKFENGKCVDAGPVDSNETSDNDTEPEQNSEKVKECVEWIKEHVVLFGTGSQIYTVQIIPDENSARLVVSQEQSKSLSPNWDFSTQESYKLYLDGSQDYEQNACETVERIQAFIADKVKENCTDIPGFELVCDLCVQSSAESNIFEFIQTLCKEEEQPIENDCPEPKYHEPCTLECQRKISPDINGDWTKNATETWWYKDKYGWKCVSKTCKKGYKTNNGFCKKVK